MQSDNTWLWNYTVLSSIHKNVDLVRNNHNGQLMIRRISAADSYFVMRSLVNIRHPNLMTVYDCAISNGLCICLCELINGNTLGYYLENQGLFSVTAAKNILVKVCDGLSALHQYDLVHRDIKPENIMISNSGEVKIIDYSITRSIKPNMSKDTEVLGTAGYASPEQFGFKQTSAKADIYACGVLLNVLLTGKLPNEQMYQGALTTVIEQCIEIDENKRFKSAEELKNALLGKRINRRRPFQPLPGFRSNRVFPKIATVFLMIIWFLILIIYINGIPMFLSYDPKTLIKQIILGADLLLFWSLIPYLLIGDVFRLSEKVNPDNPQNGKYTLRIIGVASIVFGFVLLVIGVHVLR